MKIIWKVFLFDQEAEDVFQEIAPTSWAYIKFRLVNMEKAFMFRVRVFTRWWEYPTSIPIASLVNYSKCVQGITVSTLRPRVWSIHFVVHVCAHGLWLCEETEKRGTQIAFRGRTGRTLPCFRLIRGFGSGARERHSEQEQQLNTCTCVGHQLKYNE